ncbi:hypothetical protein BKA65DRAFT_542296 [Rhexocercosporidium sp. MPI-PUGE-AT-0058]|nr:hypothetical protein BKA65DRAFT_542296 [Rhexocercosporidium sp. MPI-PUGE-AT-0058]
MSQYSLPQYAWHGLIASCLHYQEIIRKENIVKALEETMEESLENDKAPEVTTGEVAPVDPELSVGCDGSSDSEYNFSVGSSVSSLHITPLAAIVANSSEHSIRYHTWQSLRPFVVSMCRQLTFKRFGEMLESAGFHIGPEVVTFWFSISLQACPVSDTYHEFDTDRRCISCDKQLCKDCQHCVLQRCITSVRTTPPEKHVANALSVRRIYPTCGRDNCIASHDSSKKMCLCSEFLADDQHNCKNGKCHHCYSCFKRVQAGLRQTRVYEAHILDENLDISKVSQTEPKGNTSDPNVKPLCMLCLGHCRYPSLNGPQNKELETINSDNWQTSEAVYYYRVVDFT